MVWTQIDIKKVYNLKESTLSFKLDSILQTKYNCFYFNQKFMVFGLRGFVKVEIELKDPKNIYKGTYKSYIK